MRTTSSSKRSAFTLVELLVVVSIIAILVAMLLPTLGAARQQARRIHCAANLRALGQALSMYTQQYGYYPACDVVASRNFALWPVRVRRFLGGDQRVFNCPAQDERCEWSTELRPGAWRAADVEVLFGYVVGEPVVANSTFFGYGYNHAGTTGDFGFLQAGTHRGLGVYVDYASTIHGVKSPASGELRASRVRKPSEMIAITDSTADAWCDPWVSPSFECSRWWPGRVHKGGANALFCDGHVTWYPQKDLVLMPDPVPPSLWSTEGPKRRMWNNDNDHHLAE